MAWLWSWKGYGPGRCELAPRAPSTSNNIAYGVELDAPVRRYLLELWLSDERAAAEIR
jgi:hypothetical protein